MPLYDFDDDELDNLELPPETDPDTLALKAAEAKIQKFRRLARRDPSYSVALHFAFKDAERIRVRISARFQAEEREFQAEQRRRRRW